MHKTVVEDWAFTITVPAANPCRGVLEPGGTFHCAYVCPAGFCPKTMAVLHSLFEAARAGGGDLRLLGGYAATEIDFPCADGVARFRLTATHLDAFTETLPGKLS